MQCPNCKKEIGDELKFCPECGAPVDRSQPVFNQPQSVKTKKPITKKWWFWVIIAVVVIGIIAAASGGSDETKEQGNTPVVENSLNENNDNENAEVINEPQTEAEPQTVVIYDANNIKISYVENTQNFISNSYRLLVENNSQNNITVSADNIVVNDFSVDGWFYVDVVSGKKTNEDFDIYSTSLSDNGIESVEKLEFTFHIIDSDTYDTIDDSDVVTITFDQ